MKTRSWTSAILVSISLTFLPAGETLSGQGLWGIPSYEKSIQLKAAKPLLDFGEFSTLSSGISLSAVWPFTEKVRFVGELPMAYASRVDGDDGELGLTLGNPYLGVSLGAPSSKWVGQIGVRLPLASTGQDDSRGIGMLSDLVDQQGSFFPDLVPATGTLTYRYRQEDGFVLTATGGVEAWFFTDGGGDGAELFGLYGARAGYEGPRWTLLGGVAGRRILTEENLFFSDASLHELGLEVGYRTRSAQPMLFVRFPLDEVIRDELNAVVGIGVRFPI